MTRGFLILATGRTAYLQFAVNLAWSIREKSQYPIALGTDLIREGGKPFDKIVKVKAGESRHFYLKTTLNEISPWDETIYLDADSLCLNSPDHLFDGSQFGTYVMNNWRIPDPRCSMLWAKLSDIQRHYGLKAGTTYHELNTSFLHWTKGRQSAAIFALAEQNYAEDFVPTWKRSTFGWYPDELAFNAALAMLGHELPKGGPLYMRHATGGTPCVEEAGSRPFMSMPGVDSSHAGMWALYGKCVREMSMRLKVSLKIPGRQDKANGKRRNVVYAGLRERNEEQIRRVRAAAIQLYGCGKTIEV